MGHQSVGTPGRRIQEVAETGGTIHLDGEELPVRARIETLRGLSAHMDRDELLAWLSNIPKVKRVGLNHGEADAQRAFLEYARGPSVAGGAREVPGRATAAAPGRPSPPAPADARREDE